jgi:hypothetical protein
MQFSGSDLISNSGLFVNVIYCELPYYFFFFWNRKFTPFIYALQLLYILLYYVENTENISYFVQPKTDVDSKDKLCFTHGPFSYS